MLNQRQVKSKMQEYAELFRHHCLNKEWVKAKHDYYAVQTTAVFLEFSGEEMQELFGNRAYKEDWEELRKGLFPEEMVMKAARECIRQDCVYENLILRPDKPGQYAGERMEDYAAGYPAAKK